MMWETHQEFLPMIEKVWREDFRASSVEEMKHKLERLASSLAGWGTSTFGGVRKELRELKKRIEVLRSDPNRTGPTYEEIKAEIRIVELNYREEIMWRQRSRIQWLAEGDGNTQIFHQKANSRRRKN